MSISLLPTFAFLPAMALFAFEAAVTVHHPLAEGGWLAWPVSFIGFYFILWQNDEALVASGMNTLHAATLWLLTALASWELQWRVAQAVGTTGAWAIVTWGVLPAAVLAALPLAVARIAWPFQAHRSAYSALAPAGLSLWLAVWSIAANVMVSSPSAPLPYLPLVNPLDLVQAAVLLVLIRAWLPLRSGPESTLSGIDQRPIVLGIALIGFLWLNAVLLRTIHLWIGIPYDLQAMMQSTLVQSALSLLWAILALTTMLVATRVGARLLWLTGAALLVVVIVKLFLVDLSNIGTIERIVSFVGVGVLMLVLGYFSPLPPAAVEES
jgi:uncharacterized membrane protein